jgi:hypothetical protein
MTTVDGGDYEMRLLCECGLKLKLRKPYLLFIYLNYCCWIGFEIELLD